MQCLYLQKTHNKIIKLILEQNECTTPILPEAWSAQSSSVRESRDRNWRGTEGMRSSALRVTSAAKDSKFVYISTKTMCRTIPDVSTDSGPDGRCGGDAKALEIWQCEQPATWSGTHQLKVNNEITSGSTYVLQFNIRADSSCDNSVVKSWCCILYYKYIVF